METTWYLVTYVLNHHILLMDYFNLIQIFYLIE